MPLRLIISSCIIALTQPWVLSFLDRTWPGNLAAAFAALALPALLAVTGALWALIARAPQRGICLALAAPVVVLPCLVVFILGVCL